MTRSSSAADDAAFVASARGTRGYRRSASVYEGRHIGLGYEYLRLVRVALARVERSPDAYPVMLDDIRRAGVRRFPYYIYYVARASDTSVIAVLHGRRDPRRWQSRR